MDPERAALAELETVKNVEAAEGPLRRLAHAVRDADDLQLRRVRESAIAALRGKRKIRSPAGLVDAALRANRPPDTGRKSPAVQGSEVTFADPEPWPEPVDGAELLRDIAGNLSRYVALPAHAADAMALWAIHAHSLNAASVAPILALISPEKRCGKTRTLSLLRLLVPRPILASNISPAALFRTVERFSPTLLIDEADTVLRENEDLRCILNSSHTRDAAYVVRTVGDDHEPRLFSTWAAKTVALIGRLPETLADRSIIVAMHRRAPGESVERLRLDQPGALVDLHRRAARWAADHFSEQRAADPDLPGELSDRAADNWRPLVAIADLAGGDWPERARHAALGQTRAVEPDDGTGEQLLADIRAIFRERGGACIFTADLLKALHERDDRSWQEWRRGNPLSANQLAGILKRFGIRPSGTVRVGAETAKGYKLHAFADTFNRYLPLSDPSQPSQSNADARLTASPPRHSLGSVTAREGGPNPLRAGFVTGVTA